MFGSGFRLGNVLGIEVRVDWSWLFIFLLVTLSLGGGVLPAWHHDWSPALIWAVATVASLLFFASILVHELAHSLVARSKGIAVRRITLFLFGGVSNIEREPPSPGSEFLITVVGPLSSLVIGIACALLANLSAGPLVHAATNPIQALSALAPFPTLLAWLAQINILVALFNLLPGFPLDGGRLLRAAIWAGTHDLVRATHWAAGVGRALAWAFIVAGVAMAMGIKVPLLGTGFVSGLWLAFIGWFLHNAAVSSYQRVAIEHLLEDVPVSALMRRDVRAVEPNVTVRALVDEWLLGTDDRAFPVEHGGDLVGVVAVEDVRGLPRDQWDTTTVAQIMTPFARLVTVASNTDAAEALRAFLRGNLQQLPVVEGGHLAGMLRRRDLYRWIELHPAVR